MLVIPTSDLLPEHQQLILGPCTSQRKRSLVFILHLNEFLTSSGWEGDTQFHHDNAARLGGAIKKKEEEEKR